MNWLTCEFTKEEQSMASELPSTTYHEPPMVALSAALTSSEPVS